MSKLTQKQAAQIMYAHAKAMQLTMPGYAEYSDDGAYVRRIKRQQAAEAAFAHLVATLTETE
jgi:hypothetical protein